LFLAPKPEVTGNLDLQKKNENAKRQALAAKDTVLGPKE